MATEDKNMEKRILEAAEELFLEQGFAGTTTGQIAKLAGCNQALVHYYYRTKENLFDKIFEEKARLLFANVLRVDTAEIPLEDKLREMIGMHFDFLMRNPRLIPFILNEVVANPARLQSVVDKLQQYPKSIFMQMEPQLKAEIAKGNIRPVSAMDLMFTVVSLNMAPFFIMPIVQKAVNLSADEVRQILEERKKEVIETVLARLKTQKLPSPPKIFVN